MGRASDSAAAAQARADAIAPTQDGTPAMSIDVAARKRALLASLPCAADDVLRDLALVDDAWWVAAAAVAAVRAAPSWRAADAVRVLDHAMARTSSLDHDVLAALADAKQRRTDATGADALGAWLDAVPGRMPRVVLQRKLWHMRWLLSIPLATSRAADVHVDIAALADTPLLEHACQLCLAGHARGLLALVGAHATVARSLYPHRFRLLDMLLTAGGAAPADVAALRLLPGTHMPVEDRESGVWVDALAAPAPSSAAAAGLWVEHPLVVGALAQRAAASRPAAPPPPPAALAEWYADMVARLEERLGLVDRALALARAGERLGLVSLHGTAEALAFLHLLVYRLRLPAWSVARLDAASVPELVRAIAHQPLAPAAVAQLLHEPLTQYLVQRDEVRGAAAQSESAWGAEMALHIADELPAPEALPLLAAMSARAWIQGADQQRLALAVLGTYDDADDAARGWYRVLMEAAAPEAEVARDAAAPPSAPGSPDATSAVAAALAPMLGAATVSDVWRALGLAAPPMLAAACADVRVWVALSGVLAAHGFARAPRYYWRTPAAVVAESAAPVLVTAVLRRSRGHERAAVVALLHDLAPWIGAPPRLDVGVVHAVLRHVLEADSPVLFQEVVAALPAAVPRLAPALATLDAESFVRDTAHALLLSAPSCDPRHPVAQRARDMLAAAPRTPAIEADLAWCDLLSVLYAQSWLGASRVAPQELEGVPRMDVLGQVLARHADAYNAAAIPRLIALCAATPDDHLRATAMLVDAAAANGDLAAARAHCARLVAHVAPLPRVEHAAAWDIAWRTCLQLAKHPLWNDARLRAALLADALRLAPPAYIESVLKVWLDAPPFSGAPPVPRRAEKRSFSTLLARPTDSPSRGRAAQLLDSMAEHHAPHAAQIARSLLGHLGSTWWRDETNP